MKVSELIGEKLDYWVARANGWAFGPPHKILGWAVWRDSNGEITGIIPAQSFQPSVNWAHGGPIIERDQIFLQPPTSVHYNGGPNHGWKQYDHWRATVSARTRTLPPKNEIQEALNVRGVGRGDGETPLIAAMRAFVTSVYGDEVPE